MRSLSRKNKTQTVNVPEWIDGVSVLAENSRAAYAIVEATVADPFQRPVWFKVFTDAGEFFRIKEKAFLKTFKQKTV